MKRCPQCLFIYPDSDARCDFDNTPLVVVDEAELEAATTPATTTTPRKTKTTRKRTSKTQDSTHTKAQPSTNSKSKRTASKRQRKATAITAIVGLLLGIGAFVVYYRITHRTQHTAQLQATPIVNAAPLVAPITSSSPPPSASPSPTATPAPATKPITERVVTAHTNTTVAPISTSGPGIGKQLGGKPTILLTSGGKIDADEVWRTRDRVWYRRDGIVTLLKRGRVKAIVNQ